MSQQSGIMNVCSNVDSLQRRKRRRKALLVSNNRAPGSLWRSIDGKGVNYFKTSISFAQFEADADIVATRAAVSATSGSVPFEHATHRVAAQDIILLESDAKR
jgi:hypothetical protein